MAEYENEVGGMDKEGEEGSEDDHIDDFTVGHDIRRRHEGSGGNVDEYLRDGTNRRLVSLYVNYNVSSTP